jgi:hypothetical protein
MNSAAAAQDDVLSALMADEPDTAPVSNNPNAAIDRAMPAVGMSIPFTESMGKHWEKRVKAGKSAMEIIHAKWDRIFEEYQRSGDEGGIDYDEPYELHLGSDADENIIRTNIKTSMRLTYMQNPHVEFTTKKTSDKLPKTLQYIIEFMMNKQTYPGVNMKPKARRWIMHGLMTNFGILKLDYQAHDGSKQDAVEALQSVEKKLEEAKTTGEVAKLYKKLEAIHESLPLARDKGITITNVLPHKIIVAATCTQLDFEDSDFLAEEVDFDRDYIYAKYYKKDKDGGWYMRSDPKKKVRRPAEEYNDADTEAVSSKILDTVMNTSPEEIRELAKKGTLRCYYIYDRPLRRIYLFSASDWSNPLWAWEDDILLSRFYRHFAIGFGEPIESVIQPGEVSFYIGNVREINRINREVKRIRDSIFNTILYNKQGMDGAEVRKLVRHLQNPRETKAFGVNTDPDKKISEGLELLVPPSAQAKEMFDTQNLRQAVMRSANQSEIELGQQFKTNTTNKQVDYYNESREQSTGVLVGAIEDAFESLAWSLAEILVSKYSKEEIIDLVGPEQGENFEAMNVKEFNQRYRMQIAAGSTEKPTSEYKKKEALAVSQALGQIGQAAPGATLQIMIRMLSESFRLVVTQEDWDMLSKEIAMNLQKGVSTNAEGTQGSTGRPATPPNGG